MSSFLQALSGSLGTASAGGSLSASGNLVKPSADIASQASVAPGIPAASMASTLCR